MHSATTKRQLGGFSCHTLCLPLSRTFVIVKEYREKLISWNFKDGISIINLAAGVSFFVH
jgi:hypothetical protein